MFSSYITTVKPRIPLTFQKVFITSNQGDHSNVVLETRVDKKENCKQQPQRSILKKEVQSCIVSPLVYFESLSKSCYVSTVNTFYYNSHPSPLQQASYGVKLLELVRRKDCGALKDYLYAGLSPNPCNRYGESLVHTICRLGHLELLHIVLDYGGTLQVSDDYGRTPLHDACWHGNNKSFELIQFILSKHPEMIYFQDKHGAIPLAYIPQEEYIHWMHYLESNNIGKNNPPSFDSYDKPNTRPIRDPPNALSLELAQMLSSGKITPEEAVQRNRTQKEEIEIRGHQTNMSMDSKINDKNKEDEDLTESSSSSSWGDHSVTTVPYQDIHHFHIPSTTNNNDNSFSSSSASSCWDLQSLTQIENDEEYMIIRECKLDTRTVETITITTDSSESSMPSSTNDDIGSSNSCDSSEVESSSSFNSSSSSSLNSSSSSSSSSFDDEELAHEMAIMLNSFARQQQQQQRKKS